MTGDLSMTQGEAEQRVQDAQDRVREAAAAHEARTVEYDVLHAAKAALTAARCDLARVTGDEYPELFDLGLAWNVGAPVPQLFTRGRRTSIVVYLDEPMPEGENTGLRVLNADDEHADLLGVIQLHGVYAITCGGPNEEAIHGHPLSDKGLNRMGDYRVVNSRWIAEAERINAVHPYHQGGWHERLHHYVFAFHDETVECLAKDITIERYVGTPGAVLIDLIAREDEPGEGHTADDDTFDVAEMFRVP